MNFTNEKDTGIELIFLKTLKRLNDSYMLPNMDD